MRAFVFTAFLLSTFVSANAESPWPCFRGPGRTAVSKETGLLQEWPAEGPKLLLEAKGAGRGYASVVIADGMMFTLGDGLSTAEDKDEYLSAFDLKTGSQVWKTKTGPAWNSGPESWQSSRATPALDGDRIYVITPYGKLYCCESKTGKEIWTKDLKEAFGGDKGDGWGYSESVLIDGDVLVCTPGKEKNTMVAMNKMTGEKIWSSSRPGDKGAGHACIVITDIGGTKVYVNTTASGGLGVRASDGKLLWTWEDPQATAVIPTPVVRNDYVFLVAGYNSGGTLLKQIPGAGGEVTVEKVYGLKKDLRNKHGGVLLMGDYLYGDKDDAGVPYCADFLTGEVKWNKRGTGRDSAAMAAADNRLYIMFANGTLVLAKAEPGDYVETGSFKVGEAKRPFWSHPVIAEGKLYIRDQDRILVYDIKAKQ